MTKFKVYWGVLLATVFLLSTGVAFAQEKVASIDPQRVLFQHPKFEQVQKQVRQVMLKKEEEAKAAIEKETDSNKKAQIFQNKRREVATEERKLMEPLFKEIDLAVRAVANAKKITVVVDKSALLFGGLDITEDVVQELKKKTAGKK